MSVAVKVGVPGVVDLTVNVTIPAALERPDGDEIVSEAPRLETSETAFAGVGLPEPSSSVTVMVESVTPSAATEVGNAATVEFVASAKGTGLNVTLTVCSTASPSLASVAVKTGVPAVVDLTVKVTTPDVVESPDAAEIVSAAPRLDASVTVFPTTGFVFPSSSVTVIVEGVMPSAINEFGDAVTVEFVALAGAVNGFNGTRIPPMRMLVVSTTEPVPLFPGTAIVLIAAPTDTAVLTVPVF